MMGVAAGLAASGKIPFASTFAMFAAGRAYEIVRNSIGYPHLNVKIGATHAGISVGEDGATPIILASAIPQSKNRSGYAFLKIPVLVAAARSASSTTRFS